MAQILTIRLTRHDSSTPWGFRLQGGKDFGTPLLIQKVNIGSLAEKAGLQVGDALIRVNNQDVVDQRHKDTQDIIVRAGNSVEMAIQRGALSTWKPSVTPIGSTPSPNSYASSAPSPVTKTSLAATNKNPSPKIGAAYNNVSKPYASHSPQLNGGYSSDNGSVKAIVNKQYNTPVGIYSDQSIAETLSAQAEVLAGGVLGVNFKKNEKNYNAEKSEVFKMVQEVDKEPKSPEPDTASNDSGIVTQSPPLAGLRHVSAPQTKPVSNSTPSLAPGQNICAECERLIVGVFVRIKDKNLHVECFKCATCGTSLKNVGYYSINNKLYCDIHAKLIARQNPPAPNLEPTTVPPATSTFGSPKLPSSVATPLSPQTIAPVPFHTPRQTPTHVPAPHIQNQYAVNNVNSAKPLANSSLNNYSSTFSTPKAGQFYTLKPKAFSKGGTDGIGNNAGFKSGSSVGYTAPRRGRGVLNQQNLTPGARIPLCAHCNSQIRGPFVTALGKIWCPEHFVCVNQSCHRTLMDIGFVEEPSGLYCEYCFEQFLAPTCSKCAKKIKGDCLNAIGKHFHPECFTCAYCGKLFGNNPFFLEEGLPYCENDWNELFTTKCFACGFPIEAGDRWVEALNNNYHSPCFNCTICKINLEGQSFYAKGGRPFCKNHAR